MKVREVIQEFIPCEVCGNRDIKNFYFHVLVHKGSQPYVKCGECEEEYYSTKAREIITKVEDARKKLKLKARVTPTPSLENKVYVESKKPEYKHPIVSVLSDI